MTRLHIDRALVIGYGSIGKRHIRLLRAACPETNIQVLRHTQTETIDELVNGFLFDPEQVHLFRPQIAIIASPSPFHLHMMEQLIRMGCHILVEKPISNLSSGVDRVLKLAEEQNVHVQVGYNLRFQESLKQFRGLIQENRLGDLYHITVEVGQYLPSWRPDTNYSLSVTAKEELGGGALRELSHELDYIEWIFGEIEWVSAEIVRQSNLNIDVEDVASLKLGFQEGVIASLQMDFLRHDTTRKCRVVGEHGTAEWNGVESSVSLFSSKNKRWQTLFQDSPTRDSSYQAQLSAFLTAMTSSTTQTIACTGQEALKVVRVIESAELSQRSNGGRIYLKENRL